MTVRTFALAIALAATTAGPVLGQRPRRTTAARQGAAANAPAPSALPQRAVRRDIPMTNAIRMAFAAGTRDSSGRPGRNYWQLRTDYSIDARLDPATSTVSGRERIVLQNPSDSAWRTLHLRLDQNIYRANAARLQGVPEITDGMQVTRLAVNGQPLDLNAPVAGQFGRGGAPLSQALQQTNAGVPLASPVPAHGNVTLEVDWSFRVPQVSGPRGMRMGRWADTLYQVAQWYPRVAVFDDYKGWDTEGYLGAAEFYNNFGRFDVRLDVPAGWLVGATGVLQNAADVLPTAARERLSHVLESDSVRRIVTAAELTPAPGAPVAAGTPAGAAGGRQIWRFVADTVGDFAWAASKSYVWDATRATIPGRGPIPVNLLYLPGEARNYTNAPQIARHALEYYSKLWMPYAFPQLTLSDGPEMGMEYPMFIMSGQGAADHEAGHEWWPMMVGVNETWWGFMDEGFNQYMNILSDADRAARPAVLDGQGQVYGQISGTEIEPPLMWPENYAGPMYSFAAYGKAPMMLSALGGVVGDSAVQRAMSEYAHAWRFKHPTPWDFAFFMNNALHRDLGWFWYYWLFTTESVNGSIQNVATSGATTTVTVRQDGEMPSPVVLKVQFAPAGPAIRPMANATMADSATAIVTWPVDVWFAGSRTFNAALNFGTRKIEKITLDPFCRFPDRDATDNVWPRAAQTAAAPSNPMMAMFGRGGCRS